MDVPRGHAAVPLQEADFLDFVFNYYKAEYAPIRSFWSTATAEPRQPSRWLNMGHEMMPTVIRPANAQAQKDLHSLDFFIRKFNLDAGFLRGIVIRYAKYEVHERLEKKLFECARLDLMVRKALKEKHLIDALWPSPASRNIATELLAQGVEVRRWYGDMFNKYFRALHAVDQFELRPEVDQKMKTAGNLMLVPFIDHLVFGPVEPILPIIANGAGFSKTRKVERRDPKVPGYGESGKFDIRFDAPTDVTDTYTKRVMRQCQCMKCGTRRDVQVVISIDPNPIGGASLPSTPASRTKESDTAQRKTGSKSAQRYSAGYNMPGAQGQSSSTSQTQQPPADSHQNERLLSPEKTKQCLRCTFLNHPELSVCEMCQAELPDAIVVKPPTPAAAKIPSHSHSKSQPNPTLERLQPEASKQSKRPDTLNRNSLSQSLFSIFPFSQQRQQEHHANLPPQQASCLSATRIEQKHKAKQEVSEQTVQRQPQSSRYIPQDMELPTPTLPPRSSSPLVAHAAIPEIPLSSAPEMTIMPMTPPASSAERVAPQGLPTNLMDDYIPVSPAFRQDEEDIDAGWGEMSREEARREDEEEDEEEEGRKSGGFIDLDTVARDEADVWGGRGED